MFKLNFHNLDCAMTGAQIDIFQKYSIRVTYFRVDYYLQFYIVSTMTIRHSNSALPQLTLEKGAGPKKTNFERAGPTLRRAVPGRAAIRKFVNGPSRAGPTWRRAGPGREISAREGLYLPLYL